MLDISVDLVAGARFPLAQIAEATRLLVQREHHHDKAGQADEDPGEVERQVVATCHVVHPAWNEIVWGYNSDSFLYRDEVTTMVSQLSEAL